MTKIKICGLRRREDIRIINEVRPDYAGFIVEYEKSIRSVSEEVLRKLAGLLLPGIIPVGVFVNADPALMIRLLKENVIGMCQLHGQEDERITELLKEAADRPVIRAFSVRSEEDIRAAARCRADFVLLDQGRGGTGKTFDWELARGMERPYFLAGGISEENVGEALRMLSPYAVDLSSSLETEGYKDPDKIRRIMKRVREYG